MNEDKQTTDEDIIKQAIGLNLLHSLSIIDVNAIINNFVGVEVEKQFESMSEDDKNALLKEIKGETSSIITPNRSIIT